MGKQDSVQKVYWEDDTRFADLFNTIMGDGEELISASDSEKTSAGQGYPDAG